MTHRTSCHAAALACLLAGAAAPASAATMIDGGPVGGQVWTPAGSPYVVRKVNGDVSVPAGEELRIEAGTVVLFVVASPVVQFNVAGTLTINGTAAAPVIMQAEAGGTDNAWSGIYMAEPSAVIRITGAIIRNAGAGVKATIGWPRGLQLDVRIDRSTFEYCGTGLSIGSGTYAFDSIVARNNNIGIEAYFSTSVTVTNALVQNNKNLGLIAYNTPSLTIINSTVDSNKEGVAAWCADPDRAGVDIQNTILSNNRTAIHLDAAFTMSSMAATATVTHSTFWANAINTRLDSPPSIPATEPPPGCGNVVADPQYVSPTDLHLTSSSPCIDSGAAARAPDHDLELGARPVEGDGVPDSDGSTFDRGAFEFVPSGGAAGAGGGGVADCRSGGEGGGGGGSGGGGGGGPGGGGGSGSGGVAGRGGGAGGRGGSSGGAAGVPASGSQSDDGCGCDLGDRGGDPAAPVLVAIAIACCAQRRRNSPRRLGAPRQTRG